MKETPEKGERGGGRPLQQLKGKQGKHSLEREPQEEGEEEQCQPHRLRVRFLTRFETIVKPLAPARARGADGNAHTPTLETHSASSR